jgi:hypothetical protein
MRLITVLGGALALCGCAPGDDDGIPDDAVDLRQPIPEPDERFYDLVLPEQVIEPGEDIMYCYHVEMDESFPASELVSQQGQYGHHLIPMSTKEPEAPGTWARCDDIADMGKFRPFMFPLRLPEGHAYQVEAGTPLALQSHYVNAGTEPLLVRDVVRIEKMDPNAVTDWVTTVATNTTDFEIASGETLETTFDCSFEQDLEIVLMGGHLHETGTKFSVEIVGERDGEGTGAEEIYLVDPWVPEFRDAPPIEFMWDQPIELAAGQVLRTRCTWDNVRPHALTFPEEMCATFGYIRGTTESVVCDPSLGVKE